MGFCEIVNAVEMCSSLSSSKQKEETSCHVFSFDVTVTQMATGRDSGAMGGGQNISSRFNGIRSTGSLSLQNSNNRRALKLARDGRYGDANRALISNGCASHEDASALNDLHPQHNLPDRSDMTPPSSLLTLLRSLLVYVLSQEDQAQGFLS